MPCCAFAAFLLSQLVLGLAAIKRVVGSTGIASQTNVAVEWRLGGGNVRTVPATRTTWRPRRRALPVFALAALLEVALLFGAIYGVRAHLGHAHHDTVAAASRR